MSQQDLFLQRFWTTLSYACSELCLILLLHVAALASYAATRVAGVCRLRAPCILCSRLDHALRGRPWFSADSVCQTHRSEISSLAYCKIHNRLARSQDSCEGCHPISAMSGQAPADHARDKTNFAVGIDEVNEPDGASAKTGTANPASTRSSAPSRIFVDHNSSVKNSFIGRLNLPSPRPSEIIFARDNNSTTQQEVKALLSQISSVRGLDSSSSEGAPSPGVMVQPDESSNAAMGRKPPYLERSYSVLEPSDGNNLVDDVEGESSVEYLRKQLELSKKSLAALYKELEEERSASAIAASQTMAMINRLQEEKAAMQMEALQYLRMMEEQADHDHEAIQNLHDLLTDREKELLDMDAELASCRRLLQDDPLHAGRFDDEEADTMSGAGFGTTMSYFEDEKAYILESLSRLEENLCISTSRHASDDANNSQEDVMLEDHTRADGRYMENSQSHALQDSSMTPSVQQHEGGNECSISSLQNYNMDDEPSVENEILLLNTRLKALEVDHKFIKKVLSSLGSDELQSVDEITSHLAELRRVVTQRRAMAVPLVHTIWS